MCGEAAEGSSGGEVVGGEGGSFLLKQWKREWEGERRGGGRGSAETNSTPVAGLCSCGCVQRGLMPTGRPVSVCEIHPVQKLTPPSETSANHKPYLLAGVCP